MRTTYTIAALGCLIGIYAGTHTAHAQNTTGIRFGIKSGLTLARLDGKTVTNRDYKPSFHIGGLLCWRPTQMFAVQPEVLYTRQGATDELQLPTLTLRSKTTLSYLSIPVLAKAYISRTVNLQFGPQLGLLLDGQRAGDLLYIQTDISTALVKGEENVKEQFRNDVALCGGIGIDLPSGFQGSLRYIYGLADVNNLGKQQPALYYQDTSSKYNRTFEFSIGYAFGGQ